MKLAYSNYFEKRLKKQLKQHPHIRSKIKKQLALLQKDISYPSLKTHKLQGKRLNQYSIWIEGNLRITFIIVEESIILTDLITHDEY